MTAVIQRLTPGHASSYRVLMLEAYRLHPDAFTSDVGEREALPIQWWEKRLYSGTDATDDAPRGHFLKNRDLTPILLSTSRR